MSSLSQTMASFKIHQDDENVVTKPKPKDMSGNVQKRCVLGTLSTNLDHDRNKISTESSQLIKEPLLKLKNNVDEHGSTKIEVEKNEKQTDNKLISKAVIRTPLREIINISKNEEKQSSHKYESPMSIDGSPLPSTRSQLDDIFLCETYRVDIFKYLKELEAQFRPKAYYMKRQPDVTYPMRTILVDWLVEVSEEYKLHNATLFMAVSFIDRFLSSMAVVRAKLQLLGTSAIFIAAKFEEIYPPEVAEFTYITDDTYTRKQVLRMEHLILKVLSFDLSGPTAYTFLTHIAAATKLLDRILYLAMYLCELTLLEADPYLDFHPSLIASASIAMARHCYGFIEIWPSNMVTTTGYHLQNLAPVIPHLNETHSKSFTSCHAAIRDKYKSSKYYAVSQIAHKKLVVRE